MASVTQFGSKTLFEYKFNINKKMGVLTSPIWLKAAASSNPKFPPNDIGTCTAYKTCTVLAPGNTSISSTNDVITLMPTRGRISNGFRRPLQSLHGPTNRSTTVAMSAPTKLLLMFTLESRAWLWAWKLKEDRFSVSLENVLRWANDITNIAG